LRRKVSVALSEEVEATIKRKQGKNGQARVDKQVVRRNTDVHRVKGKRSISTKPPRKGKWTLYRYGGEIREDRRSCS